MSPKYRLAAFLYVASYWLPTDVRLLHQRKALY